MRLKQIEISKQCKRKINEILTIRTLLQRIRAELYIQDKVIEIHPLLVKE